MNNTSWDIVFDNVTMGYGKHTVLKDISANLPAGKITVILGGSGCGKSTMLKHIVGLHAPLAGKIIVGGMDIANIPTKTFRKIRRRMGVLFQDGALLGSLTVAENISLPIKEHTLLKSHILRKAVEYRLSLVGLKGIANYYPTELSGGMRKRVGLARALVTDPPILLCDEPTSGLDPINAAQMDELLLNMKERFPAMTTVIVSHDLESVKKIADHVLVLNDKKLIFYGSKEKLYDTQDPYLKQFLSRQAGNENQRLMQVSAKDEVGEQIRKALNNWAKI